MGKVTDLYTKLGNSGLYGAMTALVPDYDAGFFVLNAHSNFNVRGAAANGLLDLLTEAVLPALDAQAEAEAIQEYVGTSVSTDPALNSPVTISFNESTVEGASGGLSLSEWISNGTDALTAVFEGVKPRLLQTISNQSDGYGKVAFQANQNPQTMAYNAASVAGIGPFSGEYITNLDWFTVNTRYYGSISVALFVFDVNAEGNATAVNPAATMVTLERL
jgi:hypothetical protein